MRVALFRNFTEKPFEAYYNGKKYTFKPGQERYMEAGIASLFAKHLANKVLIENGKENYTSPKFPEQVPEFMEQYNKAFSLQEENEMDELGGSQMSSVDRRPTPPRTVVDDRPPQIIKSPDDNEPDEDNFESDDDNFEGD